ncbi:MAG: NAD-dependent epimerase/dehydratase family protein [Gemmatimonadetes bacterium]|nr:NAD-dependent epimerase/dehydratase family protein [Gemmatimonadota bacterium]
MRYFITGGAGFIGSHLAHRLIAEGHIVSILDDLSTGEIANVETLIPHENFTHRIGCVRNDKELVAEMVDRADMTIHLAAAVGVRLIVERPVHCIETNIGGTETVLTAAARKEKPVLIASTSEVYGKSSKIPFTEGDDLVMGSTENSRWAYACSKALDEWLALAYGVEKGVPVIVTRFFNTVGPRQTGRYGMVLPNFARQAVRGEPITVYGTGDQSRCFGHVQDAVEAVVRLVAKPEAFGNVYNVGTDQEVTINQLAEKVKETAGSNSEIVRIPYEKAYPPGFEDMMRRKPSVKKLHDLTGFRPMTSLDQIVKDVVADQQRILDEETAGAAR